MHCLVTGASGYLGSVLVPALKEAGIEVTAQVRARRAPPEADRVIQCDLQDALLRTAMRGVDVLIHLAALAHQQAREHDYQQVNVVASAALAEAAVADGVGRILFVSSIKAAPFDTENSAQNAGAPVGYGKSKWLAERAMTAHCKDSATQLTVVRPALLYGAPTVGHLAWLQRWVHLRLPAPPKGAARAMLARDDLARLLVLLTDFRPPVATLTATDGERYSTRRLHAALCASSARRPLLPTPPDGVWRGAANLLDRVRGEAPGALWERLVGGEDYLASDLAALMNFHPRLTFERSLGLSC